eukprot:1597343-Amphidinium_carterae.2
MERRTLACFLSLVLVDNSLVRAALAADFSMLSAWQRVFLALNNFKKGHPTVMGHLPAAMESTLPDWIQFAVWHVAEWPLLVKTYKGAGDSPADDDEGSHDSEKQDQGQVQVQEQEQGHPAGLQSARVAGPEVQIGSGRAASSTTAASSSTQVVQVPPETDEPVCADSAVQFACDLCNFVGKNYSGLHAHRRRHHGIHPPLSLRVRSVQCEACNMNCGLRHRVLDHFRTSNVVHSGCLRMSNPCRQGPSHEC